MKAVIEKIRQLVIDIRAHAEVDMEITLAGNGTNCGEALNVARALEQIIGSVDKDDVEKRVNELTEEYGLIDCCSAAEQKDVQTPRRRK